MRVLIPVDFYSGKRAHGCAGNYVTRPMRIVVRPLAFCGRIARQNELRDQSPDRLAGDYSRRFNITALFSLAPAADQIDQTQAAAARREQRQHFKT